MKGKGKLKSYSKDKKVKLGEEDTKKPEMTDDELMKKIKSSLSFQVSGGKKGKPGLQEDKKSEMMISKIERVLKNYANQEIEWDYEPGSTYANLIEDLEKTRLFKGSEDALSNFTMSRLFNKLAKNHGIEFKEPGYSSKKLNIAPEKPSSTVDSKPRQTRDIATRPGATPGATSYSDFDLDELLKKGKITKSQLKEIIKREFKK